MDERRRTMQWQAWFASNATGSSKRPGRSWQTPIDLTVREVSPSAQRPCSDTSIPCPISLSPEKRLAIEIPRAPPMEPCHRQRAKQPAVRRREPPDSLSLGQFGRAGKPDLRIRYKAMSLTRHQPVHYGAA